MQLVFAGCVVDIRPAGARDAALNSLPSDHRSSTCWSIWCRNRERVVSKDDLFQEVWSGRTVTGSTLTSHINAVRKAIGDSGQERKLRITGARQFQANRHPLSPQDTRPTWFSEQAIDCRPALR